jgi:signal transduction histidine kinase
VTVAVGTEKSTLSISISDDGVGAETTLATPGHGLINMRQRAEKLGGTLQLTTDDPGTTIRLTVPLENSRMRL